MKKFRLILFTFFFNNFLFSQSLTIIANPSIICSGFSSTITAFGNNISVNNYTWNSLSNSILIPNVNTTSIAITCSIQGTYTLTCTALSGSNTIQAQTTVIVGPDLNIYVSANTLTTCMEANSPKLSKPVILTAFGASNYVWFPYSGPFVPPINTSTIVVRPSSTTCYTVLGTTSACSGSAIICVSVIPQFSMSVVPSNPTICVGDQINLKIQNISTLALGPPSAFTYSWTDPQTISMNPSAGLSASVAVFPISNVTYSAEMKDSRNCVSLPQLINVTVEKCTGLKEEALNDLQIFPNPVSEILYLKSVSETLRTIELIDLNGRNILQIKNLYEQKAQNREINLSAIENGFYFLKVMNEKGQIVFVKITKQ